MKYFILLRKGHCHTFHNVLISYLNMSVTFTVKQCETRRNFRTALYLDPCFKEYHMNQHFLWAIRDISTPCLTETYSTRLCLNVSA